MRALHIPRNFLRSKWPSNPNFIRASQRCKSSAPESEYLDEPQYPPILPYSQLELMKREWHDKISKLPTYEQKVSLVRKFMNISTDYCIHIDIKVYTLKQFVLFP